LEEALWSGMKEIAGARSITLSDLVSEIDRNRDQGNLSSAIRLQVLAHYRDQTTSPNLPGSLPDEFR
jgi:predicted DNA-binding ribbon-helix-helix protein